MSRRKSDMTVKKSKFLTADPVIRHSWPNWQARNSRRVHPEKFLDSMGAETKVSRRDARLDIARGVSIIAIVLVHVLRGLDSADMLDHNISLIADRVLGLWCLSVFAFVGGTFVAGGVRRRGMGNYVWERVSCFLVVYLIWTALQGGVRILLANDVNTPTSIGVLASIWRPSSQLWYLPFLALATLVFVPIRPWLAQRAPWILGIAAVLSISMWGTDWGYVGTQGLGIVVFFVGGMIVGVDRVQSALNYISAPRAMVVSLVTLAVCAALTVLAAPTPPTTDGADRTVQSVALGVVLSLLMAAAVLIFGQAAPWASLLALCGRRSLDIYLAHIIMASGTRIVLVKLGVDSMWVLVTVCLFAGVVGSLIAGSGIRRIGLAWIFDGPKWALRL